LTIWGDEDMIAVLVMAGPGKLRMPGRFFSVALPRPVRNAI
jgi:hypothetical protein